MSDHEKATKIHDHLSLAVYKGLHFRMTLAESKEAREHAVKLIEILESEAQKRGFSILAD